MLPHSFINCFTILILIGLFSCAPSKETKRDFPQIEVRLTNDNAKYVNASEFISDIEYVALETSPQCLIDEFRKICISENYILVEDDSNCLLFSRQGKFIRKIGQKGNGSEEYLYALKIEIDEASGMVYLSSTMMLVAYRISGEFVKKLHLEEMTKKYSMGKLYTVTHWKDNFFCSNIALSSGKERYSFIVFTLDGEIVKLFPNDITFESEIGFSSIADYADIYVDKGVLNFRQQYSDTLFHLTNQLDLIPDVIFDFCGQKKPIDQLGVFVPQPCTDIIETIEAGKWILFISSFGKERPQGFISFQYGIYDRETDQLTFCQRDPLAQKSVNEHSISRIVLGGNLNLQDVDPQWSLLPGLINDIDGGLPFWPGRSIKIQDNQKLASIYQPYELLENLNEEYFAAHKIKDQEAHKRLENLLENLGEEDNPVLMIATFK